MDEWKTAGVPVPEPEEPVRLLEALEEAKAAAREQLRSAWEIHVGRVEEQLERGWREQIEQIIEERFAELTDRVGREVKDRVTEQVAGRLASVESACRIETEQRLAARLNQAARRLRQADNEKEWAAVLADTAAGSCPRVAVFGVKGDALELLRLNRTETNGGEQATRSPGHSRVPLAEASAFRSVIETGETVVALHNADELSAPLIQILPAPPGSKVALVPVVRGAEVVAVLYAENGKETAELPLLELLAALAGTAPPDGAEDAADLVTIDDGKPAAGRTASAAWSELPQQEQEIHLRAQRFARVQTAQLRLYHSSAVSRGRAERNLYGALGKEIDAGREAFRKQFLTQCPSMVDYFHLELVRTLANDDESLLGPNYPGPLA